MLAPSKSEASTDFLDWLDRMDADGRLFLSVVSIHEVEKGIALLDHKGATTKAASQKACLSGLVSTYDDKNISFDAQAAAIGGRSEVQTVGKACVSTCGCRRARHHIKKKKERKE